VNKVKKYRNRLRFTKVINTNTKLLPHVMTTVYIPENTMSRITKKTSAARNDLILSPVRPCFFFLILVQVKK